MISYWISKTGQGTRFERREIPVPQPTGNQMLVRVKAASINRGDLLARVRFHSADEPRPAGGDGAGEVVDPGTSGFNTGDRILFRGRGCFSEFAAIDPALAARLPQSLSFEQGASVPGVFITAWEGLVPAARTTRGDTVLLCGASSGVGVAALQLAKHLGARVIAVSSSANKLPRLKALGADEVVHARGSDFVDEVLRITGGKGVDVALNMVGGSAFPGCIKVAADFARVVIVGYVDGQFQAECDLEAVHGRRLMIAGLSNAPLSAAQRAHAHDGFMRDIYPALESGAIVPAVDRVFDFEDLPAAKDYVETNQMVGKVVVRMPLRSEA